MPQAKKGSTAIKKRMGKGALKKTRGGKVNTYSQTCLETTTYKTAYQCDKKASCATSPQKGCTQTVKSSGCV